MMIYRDDKELRCESCGGDNVVHVLNDGARTAWDNERQDMQLVEYTVKHAWCHQCEREVNTSMVSLETGEPVTEEAPAANRDDYDRHLIAWGKNRA